MRVCDTVLVINAGLQLEGTMHGSQQCAGMQCIIATVLVAHGSCGTPHEVEPCCVGVWGIPPQIAVTFFEYSGPAAHELEQITLSGREGRGVGCLWHFATVHLPAGP